MRLCLFGCEKPMVGTSGFCSPEHAEQYLKRAIDAKFRSVSGMGSVMSAVFESKDVVIAHRKQWKRDNPGKQMRYK